MKSVLKMLRHRGFTLIELLVVIAIIAILAAVLTPAVTDALTRGKMTGTLSNGRSIHQAVFSESLKDPIYGSDSGFPSRGTENWATKTFADSTAYFRWLCSPTGGSFKVDPAFFSAPGVPAAKGTNFASANFTSNNNAWAVTTGLADASPDAMPFLFTKNVSIAHGAALSTIGSPRLGSGDPYGSKGAVVVTKGGSASIVKEDTITNLFLSTYTTNEVIRP